MKKKDKLYFTILACVAIVLVSILLIVLINNNSEKRELAYTELITKIINDEVEEVDMTVGSTGIQVYLKVGTEYGIKNEKVEQLPDYVERKRYEKNKTIFCYST